MSVRRSTLITALKRRLLDTRDQVGALRAACSRFGDDFDEQAFASAWNSSDADAKLPALAVQAAYENSINGAIRIAQELSELAGWTPANLEPSSTAALKALRENGLIASAKVHQQLKDAYRQRGSLQHDYANTLAREIHEQTRATLDAVPRLLEDVHLYVVQHFE